MERLASRPALPWILLVMALLAVCPGCQTVTEPDPDDALAIEGLEVLGFPDASHLEPFGTYHGVFIVVERSEALEERPTVLPFFKGSAEYYNFEEGHEISYSNQRFQVGGFWYPSWSNSTLVLLREREGDFTLNYRGIPVTFVSQGSWRPAVLYRARYQDIRPGEGRPSGTQARPVYTPRGVRAAPRVRTVTGQVDRIEVEELIVGPDHLKILFEGNVTRLQVNPDPDSPTPGHPLRPGARLRILPGGQVEVSTSSR